MKNAMICASPTALLQWVRNKARRQYEQERDAILAQVPPNVHCLFHEIGFVHQLPVLVVSPFQVPPGPERTAWLEHFVKLKKENRLNDLSLLVYHYKEKKYKLVKQEEWIPLEQGHQRGYDLPPAYIQDKLILGEKLTTEEEKTLLPWREMKVDVNKSPQERHVLQFCEVYDLLTTNHDSKTTIPKDNDKLGVGTRVSVLWESHNEWYAATIVESRYNEFYFLKYDDGHEEWLPLAERDYKILSSPSHSSTAPFPQKAARQVSSEQHDKSKKLMKDEDFRLPKVEPRRLPGGTFARPPGRSPLGMVWDRDKGVWRKPHGKKSIGGTKRVAVAPARVPPLKKRKVFKAGSISAQPKTPPASPVAPDSPLSTPMVVKQDERLVALETKEALAEIPADFCKMFGHIGFVVYEDRGYLPVRVVSPFEASSDVRNLWMKLFEKAKASREWDKLKYIVYWYGSQHESSGSQGSFGFIEPSSFVPYEEGVAKGYHQLSDKTRKKLEAGKKPTSFEKEFLSGIGEMNFDLKKSPQERRLRVLRAIAEESEMAVKEDSQEECRLKAEDADLDDSLSDTESDDEDYVPSLSNTELTRTSSSEILESLGKEQTETVPLDTEKVGPSTGGNLKASSQAKEPTTTTTLQVVEKIKQDLEKELPITADSSVERVQSLLEDLEKCDMTLDILEPTMIGKLVTVKKMRGNEQLASMAQKLRNEWLKVWEKDVLLAQESLVDNWKEAVLRNDAKAVKDCVSAFLACVKKRERFTKSFVDGHGMEALMTTTGNLLVEQQCDCTEYRQIYHRMKELENCESDSISV